MRRQVGWRAIAAVALTTIAAGGCSGGAGSGSTTVSPLEGSATAASSASSGAGGASGTAPGTKSSPASATSPSAPAGTAGAASPTTRPTAAIEATVRGYYAAMAAHDPTTTASFLAPQFLADLGGQKAVAAQISYYRSITDVTVKVDPGDSVDYLAKEFPGYRDFTLVEAQYTLALRRPSGADEHNGRMFRFVFVARSASTGRWLIVGTGTSPF